MTYLGRESDLHSYRGYGSLLGRNGWQVVAHPRDALQVTVPAIDRARHLAKKAHDFHRSAAAANVRGKSTSPRNPIEV